MPTRAPTLGVHLLETITTGIYSEPLHSIREYVQNAYDSIRKARRQGLLGPDEGEIRITIDRDSRSIRICDDGAGLDPEQAAVYLFDLGNSDKAQDTVGARENAGFRGIGRMAGIAYCQRLRFETSNGNGTKCVVEFDASGINHLTRVGRQAATIVDAIKSNSTINERKEKLDRHYLEVTLEKLNEAGSPLMKEDDLEKYLCQVAPVDYDPTTWSFGDRILSFAENVEKKASLDHLPISICDLEGNVRADIRRPFLNTFITANAKGGNRRRVIVEDVVFLPRDAGAVEGWWGWVAQHERSGALADTLFAGLQVRMHNIAIGEGGIVKELFKTPSLASWCFGEIHIVDPNLTPNARRDNFEESKAWNKLKEQLRGEVHRIESEIRQESDKRNTSVSKLTARGEKKAKDASRAAERGFTTREEQKGTEQRLEDEIEKLKQQENSRKRSEDEQKELARTRQHVQDVLTSIKQIRVTDADRVESHLGKQARRVLRTVRGVLKSELNERTFQRVTGKINDALQQGRKFEP